MSIHDADNVSCVYGQCSLRQTEQDSATPISLSETRRSEATALDKRREAARRKRHAMGAIRGVNNMRKTLRDRYCDTALWPALVEHTTAGHKPKKKAKIEADFPSKPTTLPKKMARYSIRAPYCSDCVLFPSFTDICNAPTSLPCYFPLQSFFDPVRIENRHLSIPSMGK